MVAYNHVMQHIRHSIRLAACDCSGPRSFGKFAFESLSHHHPSYNSPFLITTPSRHCETDKMSWRNQGITGSNNIPLGKMRRFGGDGEEDGTNGTVSSNNYSNESSNGDRDVKRGRSPERMWHLPPFFFEIIVLTIFAHSRIRTRWPEASQEAQPLGRGDREQGCRLDGSSDRYRCRHDQRTARSLYPPLAYRGNHPEAENRRCGPRRWRQVRFSWLSLLGTYSDTLT